MHCAVGGGCSPVASVVARSVRRWLKPPDVATLFIAKGSPCENDYVVSFASAAHVPDKAKILVMWGDDCAI